MEVNVLMIGPLGCVDGNAPIENVRICGVEGEMQTGALDKSLVSGLNVGHTGEVGDKLEAGWNDGSPKRVCVNREDMPVDEGHDVSTVPVDRVANDMMVNRDDGMIEGNTEGAIVATLGRTTKGDHLNTLGSEGDDVTDWELIYLVQDQARCGTHDVNVCDGFVESQNGMPWIVLDPLSTELVCGHNDHCVCWGYAACLKRLAGTTRTRNEEIDARLIRPGPVSECATLQHGEIVDRKTLMVGLGCCEIGGRVEIVDETTLSTGRDTLDLS
jgi:hypothetical protein